jgi:hypothetical protein
MYVCTHVLWRIVICIGKCEVLYHTMVVNVPFSLILSKTATTIFYKGDYPTLCIFPLTVQRVDISPPAHTTSPAMYLRFICVLCDYLPLCSSTLSPFTTRCSPPPSLSCVVGLSCSSSSPFPLCLATFLSVFPLHILLPLSFLSPFFSCLLSRRWTRV